jgi:cytochrome c551/c552
MTLALLDIVFLLRSATTTKTTTTFAATTPAATTAIAAALFTGKFLQAQGKRQHKIAAQTVGACINDLAAAYAAGYAGVLVKQVKRLETQRADIAF